MYRSAKKNDMAGAANAGQRRCLAKSQRHIANVLYIVLTARKSRGKSMLTQSMQEYLQVRHASPEAYPREES